MVFNTRARKRRIVWPDRTQWEEEFRKRLQIYKDAGEAFQGLLNAGCIPGNLLSLLYAYTVSPTTVFPDHSRRRDSASDGLKAVAGRLDRAAIAMQELLDMAWWSEPTFASFLKERCRLDIETVVGREKVIVGKSTPDFALNLPSSLQSYSIALKHLRKELQEKLSPRRVGQSLYLAELAVYTECVTHKPIPWNAFTALVNTARPETWKKKDISASLLQKNLVNFVSRNKELYEQIRADVAEYLARCEELPRERKPTFQRWTLDRRNAGKQPS